MIFVDKSSQKFDWLWNKKHGIWLLFPIRGETIKLIHKILLFSWIFWNFKCENEVCLIVGVIVVSTWISFYYSWLFVSDGSNKLEPLSPELPPHVLYILHNMSRSDIFFALLFHSYVSAVLVLFLFSRFFYYKNEILDGNHFKFDIHTYVLWFLDNLLRYWVVFFIVLFNCVLICSYLFYLLLFISIFFHYRQAPLKMFVRPYHH